MKKIPMILTLISVGISIISLINSSGYRPREGFLYSIQFMKIRWTNIDISDVLSTSAVMLLVAAYLQFKKP
jgi:hypothetical protein